MHCLTDASPTARQLAGPTRCITLPVHVRNKPGAQDARFAWTCVKHVKSNAITIAKGGRLLGMGSGQPNRVKSTQIALEKAGEEAQAGSLAFFRNFSGAPVERSESHARSPFRDWEPCRPRQLVVCRSVSSCACLGLCCSLCLSLHPCCA